jgi:hypothetical protein
VLSRAKGFLERNYASSCCDVQILDQLCEVTGYTRKYALTLLKDAPPDEPSLKRIRRRLSGYGAAEVELLQLCWLVTDGICSKRLAPFLPELLERLRRRQALRSSQSRSRHASHA